MTEKNDRTSTPSKDLYEMLLTPEQRTQLLADLAEIARARAAAWDALASWPRPFSRYHNVDTRPWPDYDGEPIDTTS